MPIRSTNGRPTRDRRMCRAGTFTNIWSAAMAISPRYSLRPSNHRIRVSKPPLRGRSRPPDCGGAAILTGSADNRPIVDKPGCRGGAGPTRLRSEEHTSELQSPCNLVCRLLLEKKKKKKNIEILFIKIKKENVNIVTHKQHTTIIRLDNRDDLQYTYPSRPMNTPTVLHDSVHMT